MPGYFDRYDPSDFDLQDGMSRTAASHAYDDPSGGPITSQPLEPPQAQGSAFGGMQGASPVATQAYAGTQGGQGGLEGFLSRLFSSNGSGTGAHSLGGMGGGATGPQGGGSSSQGGQGATGGQAAQEDLISRIYHWLFGRSAQSMLPQGGASATGAPVELHPSLPPQAMAPPPRPRPKPTTNISSAPAIRDRISQMIGAPSEPPAPSSADFGGNADDQRAVINSQLPYPDVAAPVRVPVNLGAEYDSPSHRQSPGILSTLLGAFGGNDPSGGAAYGLAHGGQAPGFMRGGYPELYTAPMRKGHFSTGGGQNYVPDEGEGDGRSDQVDARLSPGEYVMDGETVSMLGNGNNDAGARALDKMRVKVRKHKGRALAKGKFSPNAKEPMSYLNGAA